MTTLPGISGRAHPLTFLLGTSITLSAAHWPSYQCMYEGQLSIFHFSHVVNHSMLGISLLQYSPTHTYTHTRARTRTCTRTHTHTSMHACTHTHKHARTHTHTHQFLVETEDVGGKRHTHIALSGLWIMKEPQLKRDHAFWSKINALDHRMLLPVPHMEAVAVHTCSQAAREVRRMC